MIFIVTNLVRESIRQCVQALELGLVYKNSQERTSMLNEWNHHYNWHRPHQGIAGLAPMSRLRTNRNNLLQLHS